MEIHRVLSQRRGRIVRGSPLRDPPVCTGPWPLASRITYCAPLGLGSRAELSGVEGLSERKGKDPLLVIQKGAKVTHTCHPRGVHELFTW